MRWLSRVSERGELRNGIQDSAKGKDARKRANARAPPEVALR